MEWLMGKVGRGQGSPERLQRAGGQQAQDQSSSNADENSSKSSRVSWEGRGGTASFPPAWDSRGLVGPNPTAFVDVEWPVVRL